MKKTCISFPYSLGFAFCLLFSWTSLCYSQPTIWLMNGWRLRTLGSELNHLPPDWEAMALGDFNADGKTDMVLYNDVTNQVTVWLMNRTSIASKGALIQSYRTGSWRPIDARDYNNDGKADILWWNEAGNQLVIWLMDGVSILHSGKKLSIEPGWSVIASADYDGKKTNGIILHNDSTDEVRVWLMLSYIVLEKGPPIQGPANGDWKPIDTGDFNADGKEDILWWNDTGKQVAVWLMDTSQYITQANPIDADPNWTAIAAGDFDGDEKADILFHNDSTNEVSVWIMDEIIETQKGNPILRPVNGKPIEAGDFDGDGKADILWSNPPTTVGIEALYEQYGIKMFPNPARDFVVLEGVDLHTEIEIYSLSGKKISSYILKEEKMDVSDLDSGYYIMLIRHQEMPIAIKLCIKH